MCIALYAGGYGGCPLSTEVARDYALCGGGGGWYAMRVLVVRKACDTFSSVPPALRPRYIDLGECMLGVPLHS